MIFILVLLFLRLLDCGRTRTWSVCSALSGVGGARIHISATGHMMTLAHLFVGVLISWQGKKERRRWVTGVEEEEFSHLVFLSFRLCQYKGTLDIIDILQL